MELQSNVSLYPEDLKGWGVGPALDIRFVTAESGRASFIHGAKSKELAIELLGLRTKEDCERVNRELES